MSKTDEFIDRLINAALPQMSKLSSKGFLEFPIHALGYKADEADEILNELVLMDLPFKVRLIPRNNDYCLRVETEKRQKESGYFIYRYYIDDEKVYLGRTNRPAKRYLEHCKQNEAYKAVNGIEIHKCKSKADMIFLERLLISNEHPPWNQVDADNGELSYTVPYVDYERYTPMEVLWMYS